MRVQPFGSTGRKVSVIGQGTWRLGDVAAAERALEVGLEQGLTHVDTAELYRGSEEVIGRVLRRHDRERVFLASKVLPGNAGYDGTRKACESSLRKLGTDYLDLFYLHWWSMDHPLRETMRAMEDLVDEGRVRFIGVSNFDVDEMEAAQSALRRHELAANQVLYHLEAREAEAGLLEHCRGNGVALVAYSPFGSGRFPGPESPGGAVLADVAARHGATPHGVALNFLTREDGVFAIPKAEQEEHVRENAEALDFVLTPEDVRRIDEAFPKPAPGTPMRIL